MEIDEINSTLIKEVLKKIASVDSLPVEMFDLYLIKNLHLKSATECKNCIQEIILDIVGQSLQEQREAHGIEYKKPSPKTRDGIFADLKTDLSMQHHGISKLEAWSIIYHRYLAPVYISAEDVASAVFLTRRQIDYITDEGCKLLAAKLRQAEIEARNKSRSLYLKRHIPSIEGTQIFGAETLLEEIETMLFAVPEVKAVSIEGLGGIGKTTMAQLAALSAANNETVEDILWVSVQHEELPNIDTSKKLKNPTKSADDILSRLADLVGLQNIIGLATEDKTERMALLFNSTPFLIVCDNLETEADADLIPVKLEPLVGATRILFTSRSSLSRHSFVYTRDVPELSYEQSHALIQYELDRTKNVKKLTASDVERIYHVVGGLPLALKLIAGQLERFSIDDCLAGLERQTGEDVQRFFDRIYLRIWTLLLNDIEKALLLSLLSIKPDGANLAWVKKMSRKYVPEHLFDNALTRLHRQSLIQVTGTIKEPIYRLHRTTIVFLKTQILLQ